MKIEERKSLIQTQLLSKGQSSLLCNGICLLTSGACEIHPDFRSIYLKFQWTLVGIDWIATYLRKVICFDESMERSERFEYAKVLIEVTPLKLWPSQIPVQILEDKDVYVNVEYM